MNALRASRAFASAAVLALAVAACGSAIEQQESSYKHRVGKVEELAAKASPATKKALTDRRDAIAKSYAALPADKAARSEGLGKLNQELNKVLEEYQAKVDEEAKAATDKAAADLAGHWVGGGIDLLIEPGGAVAYKKQSAGSSKSITGKLGKVTDTSFDVTVIAASTTFKLDKRPHQEGGAWKMTVDGTELTRQ